MATSQPNETVYHTHLCKGVSYTLPTRYENPSSAGQGAFGAVIGATDRILNTKVAIKKMLKPFETSTHAKRTYRELKLLTHLNHPAAEVIQLYDVFTPDKSLQTFQNLYFVFNYADFNLDRVIKNKKPFDEAYIKHIIYSILVGLKYMHSANVIHRDLKPVNIGIDKDLNVFILDFGLSRVSSKGVQTGYVSTRWWRAPEIYVSWEHYDKKLDIWSLGCIMAELVLLEPIFRGKDHIEQLNKIFAVIGTPPADVVDAVCTGNCADYINGLGQTDKANYQELFGFKYEDGSSKPISGLSDQGIDVLDQLLQFDPRKRPSAEEILKHPFFNNLHDPQEEPTAEPLHDEHDDANHSISTWKSIVWQMVQDFKPPSWINENASIDTN